MKKIVLLSFCIINIYTLQSQSVEAQWLRRSCSYKNTQGQFLGGDLFGDAVCADSFGHSYNAGYFQGFQFVMDEVVQMGINKCYINKYDSNGVRLWTKGIAGEDINNIITIHRMVTDEIGNLYVCGMAGGNQNFTLAPNIYPIGGGFIAKYDSNGNNIWCKYVNQNSTASITFRDMEISNGYLYLCGNIPYSTVNFESYTFNVTQNEIGMITKLDLDGNVIHAESITTSTTNRVYGLAVSNTTNNIYLVGEYLNGDFTVDGLTSAFTDGATNSFVLKMDENFNGIWLKKGITQLNELATVGSGEKCLKAVEIDNLDNIYAIGNGNGNYTQFGNFSFNHLLHLGYMQDIYTIKFNSDGVEQWLRFGQSNAIDTVTDIMTDQWGNSTIAVHSGLNGLGNLNFDNYSIQLWHGGLVKYDPNGNILYVQQLQENRTLRQLDLGLNSTFFGTGTGFNSGMPYVNLTNLTQCEHPSGYQANYAMVMAKFLDNTSVLSTSSQAASSIKVYPNPTHDILTIDFNENSIDSNIKITIVDVMGKAIEINKYESLNSTITINTSSLSKGVYFLKIEGSKFTANTKFIKD